MARSLYVVSGARGGGRWDLSANGTGTRPGRKEVTVIANKTVNIMSLCDDPSLDPSGYLTVKVRYGEGSNNRIECTLNIASGCGEGGATYDYRLYVSGDAEDYDSLEEVFDDTWSVVYNFDHGNIWPKTFTKTDLPWIECLKTNDSVTVYASFTHHMVHSLGCTFPNTIISLP